MEGAPETLLLSQYFAVQQEIIIICIFYGNVTKSHKVLNEKDRLPAIIRHSNYPFPVSDCPCPTCLLKRRKGKKEGGAAEGLCDGSVAWSLGAHDTLYKLRRRVFVRVRGRSRRHCLPSYIGQVQ